MSDWDFGVGSGSIDPTGMDSGLYGSDGGLIDVPQYVSDSSGDWSGIFDSAVNAIVSQTSGGGTSSLFPQQNTFGTTRSVDFGAGSTQPGGVAIGVSDSPSGGNWFDAAMKWFDDDKSGLKGATTVSLAGSFLKGIFGSFAAQKQSKNDKRLLDIRERDSQNTMDIANQKFANAGSIAQTNFGAPPPGGLIYSDKLAPRQKRAGYNTGAA